MTESEWIIKLGWIPIVVLPILYFFAPTINEWLNNREARREAERYKPRGEAMNCPINEQTADGVSVGRCWFHLPDGKTCPRHGDVSVEVEHFEKTGCCTLENVMAKRKGLPLLGPREEKR